MNGDEWCTCCLQTDARFLAGAAAHPEVVQESQTDRFSDSRVAQCEVPIILWECCESVGMC